MQFTLKQTCMFYLSVTIDRPQRNVLEFKELNVRRVKLSMS